MSQTDAGLDNYCRWCSNPPHSYIVHYGPCPRVKAIEYYPNGTLKHVEFHEEQETTVDVYIDWQSKYGVPPDGYN